MKTQSICFDRKSTEATYRHADVNQSHRNTSPQHTHSHTLTHTLALLTVMHTCHDKHSFESCTLAVHIYKTADFKFNHTMSTALHTRQGFHRPLHSPHTHTDTHAPQNKHRLSKERVSSFSTNMNSCMRSDLTPTFS